MGRKLVAAIVGGLIVFVWGVLSHMVLPIGELGLRSLPGEELVVPALSGALPGAGLYFFPGLADHPTDAEQEAWTAKYERGPRGLLVYHPGQPDSFVLLMARELGTDVLGALLVALLIAEVAGGLLRRLGFVALLGAFSWVTISLPYWNWYGFPGPFVTGELIDQVVGWTLAGAAIVPLIKPRF